MRTGKKVLLGGLVLVIGCGGLIDPFPTFDFGETDPIQSSGPQPQALVLDDGTTIPVPGSDWMVEGERIAFVASNQGVVCRRITLDSWDEVMLVGEGNTATGIDIGSDGSILVGETEVIRRIPPDWSGASPITAPIPGVELGRIECDHKGCIVATATTAEGAQLIVFDEVTGEKLDETPVVEGVVFNDVAVQDHVAYVSEAPTGKVVAYDLTTSPPERTEVTGVLGTPTGIASDADAGTIVVGIEEEPKLLEIDTATGAVVSEIVVDARRADGVADVTLLPAENRIFVTDGDREIFELTGQGALVETHRHAMLEGAGAMVIARVR